MRQDRILIVVGRGISADPLQTALGRDQFKVVPWGGSVMGDRFKHIIVHPLSPDLEKFETPAMRDSRMRWLQELKCRLLPESVDKPGSIIFM